MPLTFIFFIHHTFSKDLILGMARQTDPKTFVVFCASLREAAKSSAKVVIFINAPVAQRVLEIATKHSIDLVVYKEEELPSRLQVGIPGRQIT